jgi:hypothetical protein
METSNTSPSADGDQPQVAGGDGQSATINQTVLDEWYEYSTRLGKVLHRKQGYSDNATFVTFAAWSAETLRAEIEPEKDADGARPSPRPFRRFYRSTAERFMGDPSIISTNFAKGEKMVFDEIGSTIRAFLKVFEDEAILPTPSVEGEDLTAAWDDLWVKFTKQLNVETEEVRTRDEGSVELRDLALLHTAVRPYFEVLVNQLDDIDGRAEANEYDKAAMRKRRAELILLGNMRLVAYEQRRLQPVVDRNLTYLPDAVRIRFGTRFVGHNSPSAQLLTKAYKSKPAKRASEIFDEAFEIATTRRLYTLVIGDERLKFGRDLPLPPAANPLLRDRLPQRDQDHYSEGEFFPYDLQVLKEPRLWALWQRYDRSNGEGIRTAVDNWRRLYERLNFIVNLFRSRQQLSALYDKPQSAREFVPSRKGSLGRASAAADAAHDRIKVALS